MQPGDFFFYMSTETKVSGNPNAPANSKSLNSKVHEEERHGFSHFAARTSTIMGSSPAFLVATAIVVIWAVTGPYFHYSDSWQLVINTGTTVVTFLMVFLIQNTQNRDARALHLKLDEVIRALHSAHNEMIHIENLSDQELEHLTEHYEHIRKASEARKSARLDERDSGQVQEKITREKPQESVQKKVGEQRKAS